MRIIIISVFLWYSASIADAKYFAEINESRVVKRIIVADSVEMCVQTFGGTWTVAFKGRSDKNFPDKGHEYSEVYDDFVTPAPYMSWVLNEKRKWVAPVAMPKDGKLYRWNEGLVNWEEIAP